MARELSCTSCGRRVTVPEGMEAGTFKCPECGASLDVGEAPAEVSGALGVLELTCQDCGKRFSVSARVKEDVVSCPGCGSWVKTERPRRSVLYYEVPLPLQLSPTILRWLRFLAGFNFIAGLAAAVWIAAFYSTKSTIIIEGGERTAINPLGVLAAFGAVVVAIMGTVVLMALYWILQIATAIHQNTLPPERTPE